MRATRPVQYNVCPLAAVRRGHVCCPPPTLPAGLHLVVGGMAQTQSFPSSISSLVTGLLYLHTILSDVIWFLECPDVSFCYTSEFPPYAGAFLAGPTIDGDMKDVVSALAWACSAACCYGALHSTESKTASMRHMLLSICASLVWVDPKRL